MGHAGTKSRGGVNLPPINPPPCVPSLLPLRLVSQKSTDVAPSPPSPSPRPRAELRHVRPTIIIVIIIIIIIMTIINNCHQHGHEWHDGSHVVPTFLLSTPRPCPPFRRAWSQASSRTTCLVSSSSSSSSSWPSSPVTTPGSDGSREQPANLPLIVPLSPGPGAKLHHV
jgi:hypothetical protein